MNVKKAGGWGGDVCSSGELYERKSSTGGGELYR
jgi:hypothetical protein